jgi:hypothetical protein
MRRIGMALLFLLMIVSAVSSSAGLYLAWKNASVAEPSEDDEATVVTWPAVLRHDATRRSP